MLGKETDKAEGEREETEMKVKKKGRNTCHLSLELEKNPSGEKVSERENHPPGR